MSTPPYLAYANPTQFRGCTSITEAIEAASLFDGMIYVPHASTQTAMFRRWDALSDPRMVSLTMVAHGRYRLENTEESALEHPDLELLLDTWADLLDEWDHRDEILQEKP